MDMQHPVSDIKPANNKIDEIYAVVQSQKTRLNRFGFRHGYLGVSVFCYLYGVHTRQQTYFQQSSKYFDLACGTINIDPSVSYPLDFSDLGVVSQYLIRAGVLDLTPNVFLEDVDKFLVRKMRFELEQKNIAGFSTGAAGYVLYFLHRASYDPQQFAIILSEFVPAIRSHDLYKALPYRGAGNCGPNQLSELSLSGGICSVILLLSKAVESGWADGSSIAEMIDEISHFVFWKYETLKTSEKSTCFQDGDLGIGYALLRTGKVFNRPLCSEKGEQILAECASSFLNVAVRPDNSMLNGTAGAALVFEKVYDLTGKDLFHDAAGLCYRSILEFDPAQGIIKLPGQSDLSFMSGLTGTGAAMIKALAPGSIDFGELLWLI